MHTRDTVSLALRGLKTNAGRSLLTMLGIVIGVGAVVLMTGVGKSMEGVILGQIGILGPQTIAIFPGKQGPEGGSAQLRPDFDALKLTDAQALWKLDTITSIAPVIMVPGEARYGREETDPRIVGSTPEYYANQNIELASGSFHQQTDENAGRTVAVIGSDIAEDLFPNEDPVGKRMDMAGRKFTVIGVLKPVGTAFLQNIDERIIMPLKTAKNITGRTYADMISLQSAPGIEQSLAVSDIQSLLRQRHRIVAPIIDPTEDDDFLVRTAEQAQEILGAVSLGLTMFITIVAGISLVVGGIGMMNTMLVVVTERTREIGLRKAVGAKRSDVLMQFLIEAIFLTLVGGLLGIIIAFGLMYIAALAAGRFLADYSFAFSPLSILVAVIIAFLTGIAFGLYPARKAAKLDPITALRYE